MRHRGQGPKKLRAAACLPVAGSCCCSDCASDAAGQAHLEEVATQRQKEVRLVEARGLYQWKVVVLVGLAEELPSIHQQALKGVAREAVVGEPRRHPPLASQGAARVGVEVVRPFHQEEGPGAAGGATLRTKGWQAMLGAQMTFRQSGQRQGRRLKYLDM